MARRKKLIKPKETDSYKHPEASALMRPEVGTQAQFRKKKSQYNIAMIHRWTPRCHGMKAIRPEKKARL